MHQSPLPLALPAQGATEPLAMGSLEMEFLMGFTQPALGAGPRDKLPPPAAGLCPPWAAESGVGSCLPIKAGEGGGGSLDLWGAVEMG